MQSTINLAYITGPWRVRLRRLAVAAGLTAAVIGGVALAPIEGGQPAVTPSVPVPRSASVTGAGPDRLLVYLVATDAEKRALEQDVANSPEWFSDTYAGAATSVRVLAFDPAQEESLDALARLLPEAAIGSGYGPAIKLVDMR